MTSVTARNEGNARKEVLCFFVITPWPSPSARRDFGASCVGCRAVEK